MRNELLVFIMSAVVSVSGGCNENLAIKLDPDNPVPVTVWHCFTGDRKDAFEELVVEFNDTEGKEKGIYVTGHGHGDEEEIEVKVNSAINKEAGGEALPNLFSVYADTAFEMEKTGYLADISQYLSEEELSEYVDSYMEEGKIGSNGELRVFPIAKSTEILMINKTDWDTFAAETGAALSQLETREGLAAAAQAYYEWTDAMTPDIPEDGRAFYGMEEVANLFMTGSMQLGTEIFRVSGRKATPQVDREVMKHIWDYYYTPYIKGYFTSFGRFRSDDVKIGEIIAFTGSTAASMYFPDEVEKGTDNYLIDTIVMPDPLFEGGVNYAVQQGAGMAIMRASPAEEYAAAEFLTWFTREDNNIAFGGPAGYLPVRKNAYKKISLDLTIVERELEVSPKTYETLVTAFQYFDNGTFYSGKVFDGRAEARQVLDCHLRDKAAADRVTVKTRIAEGMSLTEATSDLLTEAAFAEWYQSFCAALEEAID